MVVAIYARKSKITNKGDSIEAQKEACKQYINLYLSKNDKQIEILEYSDEGFSGKNLERPDFQKMMLSIKLKHIECIVVYRLDRISRDVADFSELYKELEKQNVQFISTTENIDTNTPSGKAMLMMISVFSQLERETIAERIRDNLYSLSQKGLWLGGITPLGFNSKKHEKSIEGIHQKTYSQLIVNETEINNVKLIFSKYLETHSQSAVEKYLLKNGFKARKGQTFKKATIKGVLTNPVYCCADENAYNYFFDIGCNVCFEKDSYKGQHGVMPYLRTYKANEKQTRNPIENWTISIGKHPAVISSNDWIRVQELLKVGTSKSAFRKIHNDYSIFSGLLYCSKCGAKLLPRVNRTNSDGIQSYSYVCETKMRGGVAVCNCSNVNGAVLDKMLCEELVNYASPTSAIAEQLKQFDKQLYSKYEMFHIEIEQKQKQINNLELQATKIMNKCLETDGILLMDLQKQYESVKEDIEHKSIEIEKMKQSQNVYSKDISTKEVITDALAYFKENINKLPICEKREFVRKFVDKIVWDGENAHIFLLGASSESIAKQ